MQNRKLRLLVADDHRIFIEGLSYILNNELNTEVAGYALNGKEAIEKCNKENFDIVLMDINMPVIDGIHAARELKQRFPEMKIIMLSMLSDLQSIIKSFQAGADGYVLKSTGKDDLLNAFRTVRKNEKYLSESLTHLFVGRDFTKPASGTQVKFEESIITEREKSILKLIVEGYTNKQIAETLFISEKTADTHRKNLLAKLNLPNTASLVRFAIENKLIN